MEIPLLTDIMLILGLSILVLLICNKLHLPTIIGFLVTGIIAGPHGFGLVKNVHEVEILAEIGIILLLFSIGIEFSLKKLLQIKRIVAFGGLMQVGLTILVTFFIARWQGIAVNEAIFIGFLLSLSSTAIVLKLLQDRGEIDSPYGKSTLAILIFQDIIIVPMMLITPMLTAPSGEVFKPILLLIGKGIGIMAVIFVLAQYVMPKVLFQIAKTRIRELFIISIIAICLGVAWLTASVGLSLSLGAFMAGLIISESEYSHQALSNILPFRDVFNSFFFISIGMLMDISFFIEAPLLILALALGVLIIKSIIAAFAIGVLGLPLRALILTGFALCQVGEFSFILASTGIETGIFSAENFQYFISVSIITMSATPFILKAAPGVVKYINRLPVPDRIKLGMYSSFNEYSEEHKHLKDHLVIIGFGVTGQTLARTARAANIPYVIVETNPVTVKNEREKGEPIYFGDATQDVILSQVKVENAKVVVLAIPDPIATRSALIAIRELSPRVHLIVRTRYLSEMETIYEHGANEVIPQEFETSIEIFTRVLMKYFVPREEIETFISSVRSDGYEMLRSFSKPSMTFSEMKLHVSDLEMVTFRVEEHSDLVGKSLSEIGFRQKFEVTVLAVFRHNDIIPNPSGNTKLQINDSLVIFGRSKEIVKAAELFSK